MKKYIVMAIALALVASLVASPVLADSKGAVKMPLKERVTDPSGNMIWGDEVGWVIANTNAAGVLNVQVHVDNGASKTTFKIVVTINKGLGDETQYTYDDALTTNGKGKGNAHVQADISGYSGDSITVKVKVTRLVDDLRYHTTNNTVPLK